MPFEIQVFLLSESVTRTPSLAIPPLNPSLLLSFPTSDKRSCSRTSGIRFSNSLINLPNTWVAGKIRNRDSVVCVYICIYVCVLSHFNKYVHIRTRGSGIFNFPVSCVTTLESLFFPKILHLLFSFFPFSNLQFSTLCFSMFQNAPNVVSFLQAFAAAGGTLPHPV
jgi:hypothetical protein